MVTLANLDFIVIVLFFVVIVSAGFYAGRNTTDNQEDYILSGRKLGLFLFVLTNVATWYGGILGVGEFTYYYGIFSWVTQGLPYYIFAILFAFFFAEKIRKSSLLTIPDKIHQSFGKRAGVAAAVLIFILVSPAPYLLMMGNLVSLLFDIPLFFSILISLFLSIAYLIKGGYKADIITDAIEFFVMFAGFIIIVVTAYFSFGGFEFLSEKLPPTHLELTGGSSPLFLLVWFLIALWTFADPGFHQRCYAAKTEKTAKWGLVISVAFWALFDFLTTVTGLYSRAAIPDLENPVLSFPMLAEQILVPGLKGLFFAALFATIMSTLNSFLFLSGVTFGKDVFGSLRKKENEKTKSNRYIKYGLGLSSLIAVLMSIYFESVIQIWYVFGSICIPGLIFPIIASYYPKFAIRKKLVFPQMITSVSAGIVWYAIREVYLNDTTLYDLEPMIVGMIFGLIFYIIDKVSPLKKGD
ncbi:MAG: sodium:solute symporter [Melioribacteraceae bacterium]|nr:MAG: sodium:solute symporter [Melioribacteraceae bacterium]